MKSVKIQLARIKLNSAERFWSCDELVGIAEIGKEDNAERR